MPRSTSSIGPLVALLALLTLMPLGCGTGGAPPPGGGAPPAGGAGTPGTDPIGHPANANPAACLNAEEPPLNPPDSQTYNYSCHDARNPGADPGFLQTFVAFYTRLAATDLAMDPRAVSMHPNSGPFADVVVNLPGLGRLEFGRRTSFRPVWVTTSGARFPLPLLVARTGDGTAERPDRINRYSWARIVSAGNEAEVHWRYVPDPCNPTQTGTVHELFTVRADGTVTRLVCCSADTLEQAAATTHNTSQTLTLGAAGVTVGTPTPITRPLPTGGAPSPVSAHAVANPTLDLRLDDGGTSRAALESVSSNNAAVGGRFPNWVPGVSGSALSFDGYTTEVVYPAGSAPAPAGSFTLEAWIQMAAYPWGTVQIAGQATPNGNHAYSPDTVEGGIGTYNTVDPVTGMPILNNPVTVGGLGYLLSIDALGRPNIMGNFGGTWYAATGQRIPRRQWHHIAGVYDAADNELRIYVDGQEVGDVTTTGALMPAPAREFVIGRNQEPQWPVAGSEMHDIAFARSIFGHEGLIDEVRMYARALTPAELVMAATRPGSGAVPTLPERTLPTFSGSTFSCLQQTVQYHTAWNQLFHDSGFDDVFVTYDMLPTRVLFWKGMSGAPTWICQDEIWTHDQSMEWGDDHGLCEHMSDKQQRYAHVRVLEDTPARKVIHWRYAMVGVTYRLFAGAGEQSFIDEYFTLYPDGITIRFVDDWWCSVEGGVPTGFQGTYFTTAPGQLWNQVVNDIAAVVVESDGTRGDLDVVNMTPPSQLLPNPVVIWTNTRSNYRMYRGLPTGSQITYYDTVSNAWTPAFAVPGDPGSTRTPWSLGNHFPAAQVPNDGRSAFFPDRIGHSEGVCDVATEVTGAKVLLHGFTRAPEDALGWVNGWNDAPDVLAPTLASSGFNPRSYAYEFEGPGAALTFQLDAGTAIRNPGIVVRDWTGSATPTVTVGGNVVATARTGIHFNGGVRTLVVWLPGDHAGVTVEIQ